MHLGHPGHQIRGEFGTGVVIGAYAADYALVVSEVSGHVGLGGIVDPSAQLYVSDFAATGDIFVASNGSASGSMTFQGTGELGIGTTDPVYNLEIVGSAGKPGGGSWSDSSDRRLKKNVQELTGALEKLTTLEGVSFEWIDPQSHGGQTGPQAGLIAQDVEKIFPDWITEGKATEPDAALIGDGETIKRLQFPHGFNAYLIEALKELKAQSEVLIIRNHELEARVAKLEGTVKEIR